MFNEGRPFSVVYPALVLLVATPVGLAPAGSLAVALGGTVGLALVLSAFSFPLRGRALLWLALATSIPLLEPWRAPVLVGGALAGYAFFTVFFWGTLYYRLRTGAPWTNFLRFWRLVATNSDPTSGNALEQVPKLVMALAAGTLLAEEPTWESAAAIGAAALVSALLGLVAWRRFAVTRLTRHPARAERTPATPPLARRVYVIVVDGLNRQRLWQAHAPTMDRLAREGTEYLAVEPAYPARTVVCFSSMLTGASPREHGMRSNFAPRLGVRAESVFDVLERRGRRGRVVGIAHLLDPFGPRVVRSVTSVQPTARIDHSLAAAGREVVKQEDPDLLVLQFLAADQVGHVRGVRSPEYLAQIEETDRHVEGFLRWLEERDRLEDATVVLMADHGQGRGIGGHGHLDWGETPVPFVVWGRGAVPGAVSHEPRSVLELAATVSTLLAIEAPREARGRPLVPALDPAVRLPPEPAARPAVRTDSQPVGAPAAVASGGWPISSSTRTESATPPRPGQSGIHPSHRPPIGVDRALRVPPPTGADRALRVHPPIGVDRALAIVLARDEEPSIDQVLRRLPRHACGMPVDTLVVDDGSRDGTAALARATGARVVSHAESRGVGAALRTGLAHARDEGYSAAVYLDGDGEYDPGDFERLLDPVARGRADYVLGSRFLGRRDGMAWHRALANRAASALVGTLIDHVVTDAQTGYRAFGRAAVDAAEIRHDYNFAQVLTLALWGAGIKPVEVPISYRRRTAGRSFVRYPEYLRRVTPALWRAWRAAARARST